MRRRSLLKSAAAWAATSAIFSGLAPFGIPEAKGAAERALRRRVRPYDPEWPSAAETLTPDNKLELAMVFQGLDDSAVRAAWRPFWAWLSENRNHVTATEAQLISMPARHWWDLAYRKQNLPHSVIVDERPEAAPGRFWWSGNAGEVGIFLSGYESAWLPERLLRPQDRARLVDALVASSRHFRVGLHFNKGLAGATEMRRAEARAASIHPGALDAFALAIIAGGQKQVYPGLRGHEPNLNAARADAKKIAAAMKELRRVVPDSGSYSSEMSFFEKNWRERAWGPHYSRLLATKKKYDPTGLFTGHHQVGSEYWSADGFARRG